jgi:protein-tyrosine phosphatase
MQTRVLTITDPGRDAALVREAAQALVRGDLIVFPTETVYGVGASAVHAGAVAAMSLLKSRTPDKPFTLHLADPAEAERYAGPLPTLARRLIRKTWPGPLTLVVPDRRGQRGDPAGLVEEALYYQGTVGLRCPNHAVGRAILREAGVPVAGSSANLGGRPAPRQASEALADLGGRVPLAVDAGPAVLARASTVVRVPDDQSYEVLREGAITARRLERLVRTRLLFICTGNLCRSPMAAGLAARMLADRLGCGPEELADRGIDIDSAGTGASVGLAASAQAIEVMRDRGVDIRDHRSRPLTVDALLAADYIWVMADGHRESAVRLAPAAASRVALLDPAGESVPDPIGGGAAAYRESADHIDRALRARVTEIV